MQKLETIMGRVPSKHNEADARHAFGAEALRSGIFNPKDYSSHKSKEGVEKASKIMNRDIVATRLKNLNIVDTQAQGLNFIKETMNLNLYSGVKDYYIGFKPVMNRALVEIYSTRGK